MSMEPSRPPAFALWFLRLCPKRNRDVITGDLLERFDEGQSNTWFCRQVLVAVLAGTANEFRLRWEPIYFIANLCLVQEISFAGVGTALIICVPWEGIVPWNWGVRLPWPLNAPFLAFSMQTVAGIIYTFCLNAVMTAFMVLPLLAVFMLLWRTSRPANLLRVFFLSTMLFVAGDLPTLWWNVRHPMINQMAHPTMTRSSETWAIDLREDWIFVALLISAWVGRRLPSVYRRTPSEHH